MTNLYLLNGSNIGDRLNNLKKAQYLLNDEFGMASNVSEVYETQAWGKTNQPSFFNQALCYKTDLSPLHLLKVIKNIEKEIGGDHKERWAARIMDIDIIFYGGLIYKSKQLTIPHALMHLRNFVLVPLAEIEPNYVHPELQTSISNLLKNSMDKLKVKKFMPDEV